MSLKNRAITAVFLSVILIGLAFLIWAYQTGKMKIFGSQQITEGTITVDSKAEWDKGAIGTNSEVTNDGKLQLKLSGLTSKSTWEKKNPLSIPVSTTADSINMVYDPILDRLVYLGQTQVPTNAAAAAKSDYADGDQTWLMSPDTFEWLYKGPSYISHSGLAYTNYTITGLSGNNNSPLFGMYLNNNQVNNIGLKCKKPVTTTTPCPVFGCGQVQCETSQYDFSYNYANNIWTTLNPATACTIETPQYIDATGFDSKDNKFIFLGQGATGQYTLYGIVPPTIFHPNGGETITAYMENYYYNTSSHSSTCSLGGVQTAQATNRPLARHKFAYGFDNKNNKMVTFGGMYAETNGAVGPPVTTYTYLDETWVYDPGANSWQKMEPTTKPSARYNARMVYDDKIGKMVMFGGQDSSGKYYNELWTYDLSLNKWEKLDIANPPSARIGMGLTYNSKKDEIYLYNGSAQGSTVALNDFWTLKIGAQSSSDYTISFGNTDMISWNKFKCGKMDIPTGAKVTYQFAGSTDNVSFSNFSEEKECSGASCAASGAIQQCSGGEINLAGLIPDASKYLKVRINLYTTDITKTPTVDNFSIDYTTNGVIPPTPVTICGNKICETGETAANCPSDCGGGGDTGTVCGNGKCESGENSTNCSKDCGNGGGGGNVGKLVSTGQVLWFNVLIALIISSVASYLILRRKEN